jgi:23S rRNA G2069 N7-methylase RlmK/C1962 C5-methylase RlmI
MFVLAIGIVVDDAISAIARLTARSPEYRLVIADPGPFTRGQPNHAIHAFRQFKPSYDQISAAIGPLRRIQVSVPHMH